MRPRTQIDIEHVRWILRQDGYERLAGISDAKFSDIVVYSNNGQYQHVGIIVDSPFEVMSPHQKIVVLSKWGSEGEYFHPIDRVLPQYGAPVEYWTDRKEV